MEKRRSVGTSLSKARWFWVALTLVRVVLVIVFDDRGTVKRHSLVQVRSE